MPSSGPPVLDRFDRRILARVQRDALTPARIIGEAIGLSEAAVQRRLKRLRAHGVIATTVAQLDPVALGHGVSCWVGVDLERERTDGLDRYTVRMAACPEVQQCYYVTGQTDFLLLVLAPDLAHVEAFTRRELTADGNVRRFLTLVVLERVKVGLEGPIAAH